MNEQQRDATSSWYRIVLRMTRRIAASTNPGWRLAGTAGLLLTAMCRGDVGTMLAE